MDPLPEYSHTRQSQAERRARTAFWALCALLFVGMLWMVPQYGSSGDEVFQYLYGKMVYDYYATFGHNRAVLESELSKVYMLRNYGGLFDGLATLLTILFKPKDAFLLRHYLNIFFSFPAFVFAGLLAKEITGKWRTAIAALVLLVLTPRFWGECFNNPKDIPFAMAMLFFAWAMVRWLKRLGKLLWKDSAIVACSILLGISTRPGGILFLFYFLFFAAIAVYRKGLFAQWKAFAKHIVFICAAGYMGGCLCWPYALENPVLHPFRSLKLMAKYPAWSHLLFEGRYEFIPYLPHYYGVKMLLITLPLLLVTGLLLSLFFAFRRIENTDLRRYLPALLFMVLFPFLFMLVRGSALYDGVRHLLFITGLITVSAAIGLDNLWHLARRKTVWAVLFLSGFLLMLYSPLRFMLLNHPYEYTYFNETVGGLPGAYSLYETDYYMHSVKAAYNWLLSAKKEEILAAGDSLTLTSDCYAQLFYNYSKVTPARLRLIDEGFSTQNRADWDYGIFISRFLDSPALRSGYWPAAAKVIYEVKADGVPLCVVLKNDPERLGWKAWKAQEKGRFDTAVFWGRKAAEKYPKDLEIWSNLARSYLSLNQLSNAAWASDQAMKLSSDNNVSVYYAGEIAFRQGNIVRAKMLYSNYLKRYPKLSMTWLGLAQAQAMLGDLQAAEKNFWQGYLIDTGDTYRIYKILSIIAQKKGDYSQQLLFERLAFRNYNR